MGPDLGIMSLVLLAITMKPYKHYSGPHLMDYQLVNSHVAQFIRSYISKYKDIIVDFHIQNLSGISILDANISTKIITDPNIISAYKLLLSNNMCESSYHLYNILACAIVKHSNVYYSSYYTPTEEDIVRAGISLDL
ncbi:MAG: hypothetical protein Satyrvirus48_2 [Satyrvirus sp.]|uniref:Uncharacterized protein n=1 Tax=Satyrvirus sp. TaxID=2487771 RepID=A0A3G5AFB6_9VIRU|nr:MAG: hypothetical protein Satyrvirus48_2 [Satyrvirus sp.]